MLSQSENEYKEICIQIRETSNAVMRYGSTAVALSGGAFGTMLKFSDIEFTFKFAASLLILAVITLYVYMLINYKCDSHNRFVAYRNLITCEGLSNNPRPSMKEEKWESVAKAHTDAAKNGISFVSFDFCMDHLNKVYASNEMDMHEFQDYEMLRDHAGVIHTTDPLDREKYVAEGFSPEIGIIFSNTSIKNRKPITNCDSFIDISIKYINLLMSFNNKKGTWQFPIYVAHMVTFLITLQFALSIYIMALSFFNSESILNKILFLLCYMLIISIFFIISKRNMSILIGLMSGHRTIDSYFKQFMPFRLMYIDQITGGRMPFYLGSTWKPEITPSQKEGKK